MRIFTSAKRYIFSRIFFVNVSIAFALFTLLLLTKNMVQMTTETRQSVRTQSESDESSSTRDLYGDSSSSSNVTDIGGRNVSTSVNISVTHPITAGGDNNGTETTEEREIDQELQQGLKNLTEELADKPPFVIVLAQWRMGSTVVGEIFNQNRDVFYLFEPLWLVDPMRSKGQLPEDFFSQAVHDYATSVLRKFASCSFSPEFVQVSNTWSGLISSKVLCEHNPKCKITSHEWLINLCSKYEGRLGAKLIRADLENIKPLVVDDKVNVKVIHLVRDPRGAAASRIHYYMTFNQALANQHHNEFPTKGRLAPMGLNSAAERPKDSIPTLCKWMRNSIQEPDNLPEWLRGRYHLVKYEDFAESPVNVSEDLYKFVGLPFPQKVRNWVVENTQTEHSHTGVFDTHKNSRTTAKQWMADLTELEIMQVEKECIDVMEKLGYEPYASLKESA